MSFTPTNELNDAMFIGGILALLDAGENNAYAVLRESTTALVSIVFDKPSAVLIDHELVFVQADPGGDQILVQGDADNFQLFSGENVLLGEGDVSDMSGSGTLKISGTTGTRLYAGARAILGELKFA